MGVPTSRCEGRSGPRGACARGEVRSMPRWPRHGALCGFAAPGTAALASYQPLRHILGSEARPPATPPAPLSASQLQDVKGRPLGPQKACEDIQQHRRLPGSKFGPREGWRARDALRELQPWSPTHLPACLAAPTELPARGAEAPGMWAGRAGGPAPASASAPAAGLFAYPPAAPPSRCRRARSGRRPSMPWSR